MTNHVPTIEELMRKPRSELQAIFQSAQNKASTENVSSKEREAAKLTLALLQICHKSPQSPGL